MLRIPSKTSASRCVTVMSLLKNIVFYEWKFNAWRDYDVTSLKWKVIEALKLRSIKHNWEISRGMWRHLSFLQSLQMHQTFWLKKWQKIKELKGSNNPFLKMAEELLEKILPEGQEEMCSKWKTSTTVKITLQ